MLTQLVQKAVLETLAIDTPTFPLSPTRYEHFGDFAFHGQFLKKFGIETDAAVEKLSANPLFAAVTVVDGFVNLSLASQTFIDYGQKALQEATKYGTSTWGAGQTWAIEHTSANPNKAMHLGHLRNNVFSMAISHIWEAVGLNVIREYVDNNRGIAIAKLMWGYLKFARIDGKIQTDLAYWQAHKDEWHNPNQSQESLAVFVDKLYVQGALDFDADEKVQQIVKKMVVDWEKKDAATWELWEKVLSFSYQGQEKTFSRLDNKIDYMWHEHDHYQQGKDYVYEGLEKGIFRKTDEGTIITDLEAAYKLPDTVLTKSDGTSLYITQDIALTKLKQDLHKPDKMFWVVGPEQSLALRQLFAVCEQLGFNKKEAYTHLSYGYISIKGSGKMSSRKGNTVYIDDLLDLAMEKAKPLIASNNTDISAEELAVAAEVIGVGAVKYSLLRVGRTQDITYDFDESVSFVGNSGPYLQYSYARIKSILTKAEAGDSVSDSIKMEENFVEEAGSVLTKAYESLSQEDVSLLKAIAHFPDVILMAAIDYSPHLVATYLFELAQKSNFLYEKQSVLKAEPKVKLARLLILMATAQVLENGLRLLGIRVLDKI